MIWKRYLPSLLASIAIVAISVSRAPAQTGSIRQDLPKRTELGRVGLERQWFTVIPMTGLNEQLLTIDLHGNLLFAQTNLSNLYVIEPESGRIFWKQNLGIERGVMGSTITLTIPPAVNSMFVFAGSNNTLFCFDKATGRPVWQYTMESGKSLAIGNRETNTLISSGLAADEHRVLAGMSAGRLVSLRLLDKKTGKPLAKPEYEWSWQTNDVLSSRPIPAERVVVFGGRDSKVYVATVDEPPQMLLRFKTGGQVAAPLGAYGTRSIIVPSFDQNVYSVDVFDGNVNWTFSTGAPVDHEPIIAGKDIFVVNVAGALSAIDADTGRARWTRNTGGGQVLAIGRTRLYLQSHDHDLFIVDRRTGTMVVDSRSSYERAGLNLREYTVNFTNSVTDRIYLSTPGGTMVCLREIGESTPMLLRDPNQPPFGYLPPEKSDSDKAAKKADDAGSSAADEKPAAPARPVPKAKASPKAKAGKAAKKADQEKADDAESN